MDCDAKEIFSNFILKGRFIGISTGKVTMIRMDSSLLIQKKEYKLENGCFIFKGKTSHTHLIRLFYTNDSDINQYSKIIFIDKGLNTIHFTFDEFCVESTKYASAKSNIFYNKEIGNLLNEFDKITYSLHLQISKKESQNSSADSLKKLLSVNKESRNNSILNFIGKHSRSYISFWLLSEMISREKNKNQYTNLLYSFNNSIKNTYSWITLNNKLGISKLLSSGNTFPSIQLVNTIKKRIDLKECYRNRKYILLNFWFSYCSPCLKEAPHLKDIYRRYNSNGFELINISVDTNDNYNNMIDIIKKYGMDWQQLWDENGLESKIYSINSFPSNFLLDSDGKILNKNISADDLVVFLKEHL